MDPTTTKQKSAISSRDFSALTVSVASGDPTNGMTSIATSELKQFGLPGAILGNRLGLIQIKEKRLSGLGSFAHE